jgi:hypothetical protein
MWLHRVTPDPFQIDKVSPSSIGQQADSIFSYKYVVVAKFDRFGNGARRSDFEVGIGWSDVEEMILQFSRLKHPAAVELDNAMKLAKALAQAGWTPTEASK